MRYVAQIKYLLSTCVALVFIYFSIFQLYIFAANTQKEKIIDDLQQETVRFDSDRSRAINDWKAGLTQSCLWAINLTSLEINEILLDQALSIGEEFEKIVPILQRTIEDTDRVIKCAPMRYQAVDLRRQVEFATGFDEVRDTKLEEYVNSFSKR